ncbi:hypothetical protein BMS3Bbin06_00980 [bacterium BMS3Bbin06]|nr:hypothetical protein BMS3Bbin06_00980 [bacterium BMS3Bbin06]
MNGRVFVVQTLFILNKECRDPFKGKYSLYLIYLVLIGRLQLFIREPCTPSSQTDEHRLLGTDNLIEVPDHEDYPAPKVLPGRQVREELDDNLHRLSLCLRQPRGITGKIFDLLMLVVASEIVLVGIAPSVCKGLDSTGLHRPGLPVW